MFDGYHAGIMLPSSLPAEKKKHRVELSGPAGFGCEPWVHPGCTAT